MPRPSSLARPMAVLAALVLLTGCAAGTRSASLGVLPRDERLVTLVVSEDLTVVRRECPFAMPVGSVLGCQTSRLVTLPDGTQIRTVKVVRYADGLPSALSFEIDVHEMCHALAAVQGIEAPCHVGNGGVVQHHPAAAPRGLFGR